MDRTCRFKIVHYVAVLLDYVVYSPPRGATHLQTGLAVELCHWTASGVVDDLDLSLAIGVPLGFVTRDIVEVDIVVVREVKKQVVRALRLNCGI